MIFFVIPLHQKITLNETTKINIYWCFNLYSGVGAGIPLLESHNKWEQYLHTVITPIQIQNLESKYILYINFMLHLCWIYRYHNKKEYRNIVGGCVGDLVWKVNSRVVTFPFHSRSQFNSVAGEPIIDKSNFLDTFTQIKRNMFIQMAKCSCYHLTISFSIPVQLCCSWTNYWFLKISEWKLVNHLLICLNFIM